MCDIEHGLGWMGRSFAAIVNAPGRVPGSFRVPLDQMAAKKKQSLINCNSLATAGNQQGLALPVRFVWYIIELNFDLIQ